MSRNKLLGFVAATLALAFFGLASPVPAQAYTTDGLVLNFDASDRQSLDPDDLTTWMDISPTGVSAYLTGTVTYGQAREAVVFHGDGAYYDVDGDFRDFSNGMTLEFGASFGKNADHFERIFDFGMGAETNGIIVGREATSENVFLETWASGVRLGRCVTTTDPLADDAFHQWYFILDDDLTCRIYRDNVLQDTFISWSSDVRYFNAFPPVEERTVNYIARSAWGNDAPFEGYISYIRIYTDDLTAAERNENAENPNDIASEQLAHTGTPIDVSTVSMLAVLAIIVSGLLRVITRRG